MAKATSKPTPTSDAFNASRNEWLNRDRSREHAAEFAATVRHEAQLKELRAIRKAVAATSAAVRRPPAKSSVKKLRGGTQAKRIREVLQELYPDGKAPAHLMNKTIYDAVCGGFEHRHWRMPGETTVEDIVKETRSS